MSSSSSSMPLTPAAAKRIMSRIDELAEISESPDCLTRRFATKEHRMANDLVTRWMKDAGMQVREDAIGNVVGRYSASESSQKTSSIMLGSHLDTVINAGRFDGMLGVLSALACVESLHEQNIKLAYAIEVVGFADEEGVRYQSTYLGSRAMAGRFNKNILSREDDQGITLADALTQFGTNANAIDSAAVNPDDIHAYIELHIEQGPVLENGNTPVGVVSSISGATRLMVNLTGYAGHAGTVPMNLRRDALAAAAECISIVERNCSTEVGLVGTVGRINAEPGAGNVIPGHVLFSIDVRAASDSLRVERVNTIMEEMSSICASRNIEIDIENVHEAASVNCDEYIVKHMQSAVASMNYDLITLPSGAGHDAAAMADIAPVGMLFVRCREGISHHPDESVTEDDAISGAQVLMQTVLNLCD